MCVHDIDFWTCHAMAHAMGHAMANAMAHAMAHAMAAYPEIAGCTKCGVCFNGSVI